MKPFAPLTLAFAGHAVAQTLKWSGWLWNKPDCGADLSVPDLQSVELTVFEEGGVWPDKGCQVLDVGLRDWDQEDGTYPGFIDGGTIADGCYLIIFDGPPSQEEGTVAPCARFVRRMDKNSTPGCVKISFPPKFGYA